MASGTIKAVASKADINALSDQMANKETASFTTTHTTIDGINTLVKRNGVVSFALRATLASDVASFGAVATIPSGFRPSSQQIYYSADTGTYDVTKGGNLRIALPKASGTLIHLTGTYVVD